MLRAGEQQQQQQGKSGPFRWGFHCFLIPAIYSSHFERGDVARIYKCLHLTLDYTDDRDGKHVETRQSLDIPLSLVDNNQ